MFKSILAALITASLSIAATDASASVGKVTEQTGPTEIQRDKESIPSELNTGVEMNDAVVTANGKAGITFQDETKVEITEQSKLVIDEFVFDPSQSDAGKLAIKIAMGTAKYASGQIAKDNPQSVKIETPTATIGVRGTDFSMTVDELGRSLIVLLPSCPVGWKNIEKDCKVGKIIVTTDMGEEILDQPFQATVTKAKESSPSKSVILKLDMNQINNLLILVPPKVTRIVDERQRTALDINFLDKDFLKFDELNTDMLAITGNRLDVNYLDQEFLANLLELLNSQLLESMLSAENQMLPGYKVNKAAGLLYFVDYDKLYLYRSSPSAFSQVSMDKDAATTILLNQSGLELKQNVNMTGGTVIKISQNQ